MPFNKALIIRSFSALEQMVWQNKSLLKRYNKLGFWPASLDISGCGFAFGRPLLAPMQCALEGIEHTVRDYKRKLTLLRLTDAASTRPSFTWLWLGTLLESPGPSVLLACAIRTPGEYLSRGTEQVLTCPPNSWQRRMHLIQKERTDFSSAASRFVSRGKLRSAAWWFMIGNGQGVMKFLIKHATCEAWDSAWAWRNPSSITTCCLAFHCHFALDRWSTKPTRDESDAVWSKLGKIFIPYGCSVGSSRDHLRNFGPIISSHSVVGSLRKWETLSVGVLGTYLIYLSSSLMHA